MGGIVMVMGWVYVAHLTFTIAITITGDNKTQIEKCQSEREEIRSR